ncbi:hypothetical protein HYW43_03270 [Candidatus Daviesbacteria bacterium]|nr:hypothetical protein [Candidatus Daviesbacteria bacterium]
MSLKDILDVSLVTGIVIVSICIVYITFYLIRVLKSITDLTNTLTDTTLDVKEKLQKNVLTAIPGLIMGLIGTLIKKRR